MSEQSSQMKDDSGPVGQTGYRVSVGSTNIRFTQQHAFTNINGTWNIIYHTLLHRFLYPLEGLNGSVPADWQICAPICQVSILTKGTGYRFVVGLCVDTFPPDWQMTLLLYPQHIVSQHVCY